MRLSIIIPTLNEAENIDRLLKRVNSSLGEEVEVIVVDGGSTDDTVKRSQALGATVYQTKKGRAKQMNLGATKARGDVLYFIHSDTLPPVSFKTDIEEAINNGFEMGCYRFKFDSNHPLLKINSFFTRFSNMWSRGGDQSLFIKKQIFESLAGYKEEFVIMEEYDLLRRARDLNCTFIIMPKDIVVSARKYDDNNYFRVQIANLVVYNMFRFGYQPQRILSTYRKLIDYRS